MSVPVVNLTLDKGTDFEATFDIFNSSSASVVFDNYTGACKIRKHPTSVVSYAASVGISTVSGEVIISMGKTMTSQLSPGRNLYDVILTSNVNGSAFKLVEGSIIVSESVSL